MFSNCLVAGGFIHVSGQHAGTPTGAIGGDSVEAQTREALRRVLALIEAAGGRASDVVKLTVFLTDMSRRAEVGTARREVFAEPFPCSTLVGVEALVSPDLLVEIDALVLAPA
nr:RidA family protein [Roseomonas acroporae]